MPPNSATALTAAARTASRFFKEPSSLHRARPPAPAPIVPERALRNWHAIGRYVTVRPTLAEQWSTLRSQVERDAACPVPELNPGLGRWLLAPQLLDQAVQRNHLVGVHQQHSEQGTTTPGALVTHCARQTVAASATLNAEQCEAGI